MSIPLFFVVGAAKAGTTSVYHYLKQHPEVHVHPYKDVACYFCERYGMPITPDEFSKLMIPNDGRQVLTAGDVCSDYLTDPQAARRIAQSFPHAKIIIILRNPADRAYSLYQWMTREGYEYLTDFRDALEAEPERLARQLKSPDLISPTKDAYLYFNSGLYSRQIQRYLDYFHRDQVLILSYDDLRVNGVTFMQRIYAFLGVCDNFIPEIRIHNRAGQPWSIRYQYFCRRWLTRVLPNKLIPFLMWLNPMKRTKVRLDTSLRKQLSQKYSDDIKATSAMTGLNLQSWLVEEQDARDGSEYYNAS